MFRKMILFLMISCICPGKCFHKFKRDFIRDGHICAHFAFVRPGTMISKCSALCATNSECKRLFVIPEDNYCMGCSTYESRPSLASTSIGYGRENGMVFHQNSASSHTANMVIDFLKKHKVNYNTPAEWTPKKKPDAASLDFIICGILKLSWNHLSYRYLGCYTDYSNHKERTLSGDYIDMDGMTNDICFKYCIVEREYIYFGTQSYTECRCGNSHQGGTRRPDVECNTPCKGDRSQMCGGPWKNSVYESY